MPEPTEPQLLRQAWSDGHQAFARLQKRLKPAAWRWIRRPGRQGQPHQHHAGDNGAYVSNVGLPADMLARLRSSCRNGSGRFRSPLLYGRAGVPALLVGSARGREEEPGATTACSL